MPATQSSPDSAQSAKVFAEVAERSGRLMGEFFQRQAGDHGVATSDELGIARAFMDLTARMLADPWKLAEMQTDRKSTRLNSSHITISYAVFCLKKKTTKIVLPYSIRRIQ